MSKIKQYVKKIFLLLIVLMFFILPKQSYSQHDNEKIAVLKSYRECLDFGGEYRYDGIPTKIIVYNNKVKFYFKNRLFPHRLLITNPVVIHHRDCLVLQSVIKNHENWPVRYITFCYSENCNFIVVEYKKYSSQYRICDIKVLH